MRRRRYSAAKAHEAVAFECLRRGLHPSLRNMASVAGVSSRSIARWWTGQRSIDNVTADLVEEATGVHVSHLEAA